MKTKSNILVSIIIPTFGRPRLLKRAIESCLKQSYEEIEIIVVDDNNPNTEFRLETEILLSNYITNSRIQYLKHESNKNGSAARNTGLLVSKGDYVTFLDDDDEMLVDRISKCVEKMQDLDDSWGACYSDFEKIKMNGNIETCGETRTGNLYVQALMRSLYIGSGSNLFLRSKQVKDIGGFDVDFNRNQDLEFLARFLEHNKLAYLNETTLIIHYDDIERLKNNKSSKEAYLYLKSVDEFFLEKFRNRINSLSQSQKKKVFQFIALERFRHSIKYKMVFDGLTYCYLNRVNSITFLRYCLYMVHRKVTNKVYGFEF